MRYIIILMMTVIYSVPSSAAISFENKNKQHISEVAQTIEDDIQSLPEVHFLSDQQHTSIETLLSHVINEQESQIASFKQVLASYRADRKDVEMWDKVQLAYHSSLSLSQSKQHLLELSRSSIRELVVGFGPTGVTQFKSELLLTRLNLEYYLYQEARTFKHFVDDIRISPVPVLMVFFKAMSELAVAMFFQQLQTSKCLV